MTTYLICYDLNKDGQAYADANRILTDRIKELFSTWWQHLNSTWIVVTDMEVAQIRDELGACLDKNDELLVVLSGEEGAWQGFNDAGSDWLRQHL